MSQRKNHRRGEKRHQDNGPTWESPTPGAGCNSTHVARARTKSKRRANRVERRTGAYNGLSATATTRSRPKIEE